MLKGLGWPCFHLRCSAVYQIPGVRSDEVVKVGGRGLLHCLMNIFCYMVMLLGCQNSLTVESPVSHVLWFFFFFLTNFTTLMLLICHFQLSHGASQVFPIAPVPLVSTLPSSRQVV